MPLHTFSTATFADGLHQRAHQPNKGHPSGSPGKPFGDVFRRLSPAFHLVWGRVVPDIPDFCRELVAALAEE